MHSSSPIVIKLINITNAACNRAIVVDGERETERQREYGCCYITKSLCGEKIMFK